jgi:hypothetical protein
MTGPARSSRRAALAVLVAGFATNAGAGGSMDEDSKDPNAGPSYYGFVKDAVGALVPDARVSAGLKGGAAIVTRTDLLGIYRIPGFDKKVSPDDVTITCAKDGYKQVRTVRRPATDPAAPVETQCFLERQ